jgi:murein DD-endopeptidase MepM/ murein hydrolase activator NlpD
METRAAEKRAFRLGPITGPAVALSIVWCSLAAAPASADFYRYLDKDGVEVYTNTPNTGSAVAVLREPAKKSRPKRETAAASKTAPTAEVTDNEQEALLPVKGVVTSKVGWRHDPIDGGIRHHNGVDIAVPTGTGVKAIAAGRVVQSGFRGGYGNLVTVEHPDGMTSLYGHNSQLIARVGDQIQAGDTIALSGSTGRSTGPHLHFELWKHGVNITQSYLSTGSGLPEPAGSIRSYLHSDGSIVFTNLR